MKGTLNFKAELQKDRPWTKKDRPRTSAECHISGSLNKKTDPQTSGEGSAPSKTTEKHELLKAAPNKKNTTELLKATRARLGPRRQRAHPEERLQQGALSRAGAAHHPQRRAPRQLEAEALQHQRQLLLNQQKKRRRGELQTFVLLFLLNSGFRV